MPLSQTDIVEVLRHSLNLHLPQDTSVQKHKGLFYSIAPVDHQYWISCNTNVIFDKPKLYLSGTIRYYNLPTQTYGTGNKTSEADALPISFSYLHAYQILFRELWPNCFAGIGYKLDYHWDILAELSSNRASKEFKRLEKSPISVASSISANFQFDNRRNGANPQNGTYVHLQYRPTLKMLGSTKNWQSLVIDIRHYFKLPASSRNVLAIWSYNDITLAGTPTYLDLPSIGWDDYSNTGRGYEAGRFMGRNLVYFESEYRFPLTYNGLLGGVVFGNVESIMRNIPSELHTIIPAGGVGLRIKMNKFQNTNITLDYGIGMGGSWSFSFNIGESF